MQVEPTCHISVMEQEVLESLRAKEGGRFLDCTLGGAGHTRAILTANENNRVVALDRDARAILRASSSLEIFGQRFVLLEGRFSELSSLVGQEKFNGVLADLGLSSDQLSEQRGFSYNDDNSLDMRMDERESISATELVNQLSEQELFVVLRQGGVGAEARSVARAIVKARPISNASQLAQTISRVSSRGKKAVHPATVPFQALRMAVNREIEELSALLEQAPALVASGGRFVVISFQSLEDKLVASKMRAWAASDTGPALWPGAMAKHQSLGKLLTRKALKPSSQEIVTNPRSRSARLRSFEFSSVHEEAREG